MLPKMESHVSQTISIFDGHNKSAITLPPPISHRGHQRSKSAVESPPLLSRTLSLSPNKLPSFAPFGRKPREPSTVSPPPLESTKSTSSITETPKKVKPGTVGKITSWFEGSSEPVNIALVPSPKKDIADPFLQLDYSNHNTDNNNANTNMDNLTHLPQKRNSIGRTTTNTSMFSFFKKSPATLSRSDPDELVQMDLRGALLPDGPVENITPTAFKSLQLSAESLLRKFQSSYAENLNALRQITSEKAAQADELEAEQTRNEHLKMQLLEMAEKASDQETVIASLKLQLANPQPTVWMIDNEDQFTSRKHHRRNRVSHSSASDESFLDSDMSSALSVFSDTDSIETPGTSVAPSPRVKHARLHSPMVISKPQMQANWQTTPVLVQQCQNCQDASPSEAWDVVEIMKMENAGLKQRLAELESAHESALGFLDALKL